MAVDRRSSLSSSSFNNHSSSSCLLMASASPSSSSSHTTYRDPHQPRQSLSLHSSVDIHDFLPSFSSSSLVPHSSAHKLPYKHALVTKRTRGKAEEVPPPQPSAACRFCGDSGLKGRCCALSICTAGNPSQLSNTCEDSKSSCPCFLSPITLPSSDKMCGTCLTSSTCGQKLPCVDCPVDKANNGATSSSHEYSSNSSSSSTREIKCLSMSFHPSYHSASLPPSCQSPHPSSSSPSVLDSSPSRFYSSASMSPSSSSISSSTNSPFSQASTPSSSSSSSSSSSFASSSFRTRTLTPLQSLLKKVTPFELSTLPPRREKDRRSAHIDQDRTHARPWSLGRQLGLTLLLLLVHLLVQATPSYAQVHGENMRCHQEGEAVTVPKELIKDNPCLECVCEDGFVFCNKRKCPSMEGCYWKLNNPHGQCCQECKGCEHEGKMYQHGSSWSDGCSHYECQSGVLTVSQTQCYQPCFDTHPLVPGQCCKRCQGCWFEGRHVPEGEVVASNTDPCIRCQCSSGKLSCEKKACPVLSCPAAKQIPSPDGCCKTCQGSRNLIAPPGGRCFLNSHLYHSGSDRILDPCTTCTCDQGYITCQRRTCPVLNCTREFQIMLENDCCPTCSAAAELENVCRVPGMVLKNGDQWKVDKCTLCNCTDGATTCRRLSCEYDNKPCPPNYKRVESEDECCPKCVEAPGVCVVFGDPHYLTFDGLLFNFQGACRYTLAKSCKGRSFSLKVNNDARRSALFSWTKSLSLNIPGAKVKLGQKLRTKVNGNRIKSRHFESDALNITRQGLSVLISTRNGISILWDGASYVEVEVPLEMKGQLCGLCGNYNGNRTDDLTTSDGTLLESVDQMAMSWSTGKVRQCSRKVRDRVKAQQARQRNNDPESQKKRSQRQNCPVTRNGLEKCGILNSTIFEKCHEVFPIDDFYKSCVLDMCECSKSTRRCECDTIQAYARQCMRLGIPIEGWRQESKCGGMECPHGAEYMECAPPCRPSCRNPKPNVDCYTRRCRAGCFCPHTTVLHRGTCIPVSECPGKVKRRHRNH